MIKISAEQMRAFEAPMRKEFEQRMAAHMRVRSDLARTLAPEQLHERIERLVAGAVQHGIDEETDVRRFIELVFERVPQAVQDPEVVAILKSGSLSSPAKVAFIADVLKGQGR